MSNKMKLPKLPGSNIAKTVAGIMQKARSAGKKR